MSKHGAVLERGQGRRAAGTRAGPMHTAQAWARRAPQHTHVAHIYNTQVVHVHPKPLGSDPQILLQPPWGCGGLSHGRTPWAQLWSSELGVPKTTMSQLGMGTRQRGN